jgi:diadenylate cyclase
VQFLNNIVWPDFSGLIEILCLAIMFYYIILFFKGTRGAPTLTGFVFIFIMLLIVTRVFRLDELNWLLQRFSMYLAIALLVIFQPEIRRALAEIGKQHLFSTSMSEATVIERILKAVFLLSKRKIGALIAIEQNIGTRTLQESGIIINSEVTTELLVNIFIPNTPLHDGGVIIREDRIAAARCVFPLSRGSQLSKALGTRHRAAVGLSEETDAIVLVVSEETGNISLSHKGRLFQNLNDEQLRRFLSGILIKTKTHPSYFGVLKQNIKLFIKHTLRKRQGSTEENA